MASATAGPPVIAAAVPLLVESLRTYLSLLFFSFAAAFLLFAFLLLAIKSCCPASCCGCHVCRAYVAASWADDFDNLSDWYAHLLRLSPTGTIHVHVLGNTITANPQNVEHMLRSRFDNYPKGKPFSAVLGDLLGRGIFNVDGEPWHFQRKMASLELGSISVRSHAFGVVAAEVRHRLFPLLSSAQESGRVLDLQDVFRRFAFDGICKISFGLDPGCLRLSLPLSDFAVAFDKASRLSAIRATATSPLIWKLKRFLNIGSERELRRAIGKVNTLAEEVIRQRRTFGSSGRHDLLSHFMASVECNDRYLRDIVISFLLAGRDTVASGLTTFFMLLSKHPHVATAMRDEIDRVRKTRGCGEKKDEDDEVTAEYAQLRDMHYVHAAIHESLRLYPPVQFDSKFCLEDDVLPDGTVVTKNTRVTYHPYAMGRMESIWGADCLEFRPERWLQKDGKFSPESPFKYPVFQGGLRVCLGKEMALMEMKAVVVSVVSQFDVEVLDEGRRGPKFAPGLTATIAGGASARVHRRRR